ncbi:MAG: NUDIX domain-containing protein [Pseudomonadota bacterium]
MKRIGEPWLPGRPYRDRRGAYGILVDRSGDLLLVDQGDELQLPGGGIDPGESPLQALHREAREETGWRIAAPRLFGTFQRFNYLPEYGFWARKVQSIYLARAVRALGPPTEPDHIPLFMAPALAVRRLDVEGDREMVRRALFLGVI